MLQVPDTDEEWRTIAEEFSSKWNFDHCVGAIDGKHIAIVQPPHSGSVYYNYKHFNSIVLLAVVDASYRFLYVDIGSCGRMSDGGVFNRSSLAAALESHSLNIPPPEALEGTDTVVPYVFVADDAFSLKENIMKPYSQKNLTNAQRVFNYRLSRARRTVENAFGILSQRFRIFSHSIHLQPEKAELITMTACCLHNFLLRDTASATVYMQADNDITASNMRSIARQGCNRSANSAMIVRTKLTEYFNSARGAVPWQESIV